VGWAANRMSQKSIFHSNAWQSAITL